MQAPQKDPYRSLRRLWYRARRPAHLTHYGVVVPTAADWVPKTVRDGVFTGQYEANEAVMVRHALREGDRVVEIGTGTGFVSALCAKICGSQNVFSFEANPKMDSLIRETYRLNDVAPQLRMRAVTTDGAALSFFAADNLVSSSAYARDVSGQHVTVESVTIAAVLRDLAPTVLVMDVEGAEVDLLPAANLTGVRCIILETHPQIVGKDKIDALISGLTAQGFSVEADFQKNVLLMRTA